MQAFASMRSTPFMETVDKGGEIVQRYKSFEIEIEQGGEIRAWERLKAQRNRGWIWTWTKRVDKEGSTLKKEMDQNSWTREAHK